jgi:hypothetical protein
MATASGLMPRSTILLKHLEPKSKYILQLITNTAHSTETVRIIGGMSSPTTNAIEKPFTNPTR